MTEEKPVLVPTSSMSFERQVLILRAYVVLTNKGTTPVHYKKVMRSTRLARSQISGVNSFFVSLGFLERVDEGTYIPKQAVVDFFSSKPGQEDYSNLVPALEKSPLFQFVRNLVLIHGTLSHDELIEHLLEESGEKTVSRAKRSLQWLEKTKLIEIDTESIVIIA
jgi:hypothetical protein